MIAPVRPLIKGHIRQQREYFAAVDGEGNSI
jgi:hypothetical protein